MIDKNAVKQIAEDYLRGSEYYLVDVEVRSGNVIVVEIDHDRAVSIDDCIKMSRHIESKLDRNVDDYELEVGSAGIAQPFKILRQYQKNKGKEVEVLSKDGRKLYGILKDADEEGIVLSIEKKVKPEGYKRKIIIEEDLNFRYEELKYTKYLIRFK